MILVQKKQNKVFDTGNKEFLEYSYRVNAKWRTIVYDLSCFQEDDYFRVATPEELTDFLCGRERK